MSKLHLPSPKKGLRGTVGRPFWLEIRAPFEMRALRRSPLWHGAGIPSGSGRGVLLIPGFMSGEHKAGALAHVLGKAGWDVEVARVGRNAGPAYRSVDAAQVDLEQLADRTGQRVAIVGHSRGGQMGRVLAVRAEAIVSKVVAVGAPLRTKYPPFFVVKLPAEALDRVWRTGLFGTVHHDREQEVDDHRYLPFPESVDLISVYSRTDGIIDWRHSFDEEAEMVEVSASHLGLMNSVGGITAIAEQLA